jgi:ribonucleotide monophosphatase NagD (HAD superfamily)
MPLAPLLAKYDNVLLDLDGCVWVGDTCTPGAPQAIS